VFPIALLPKLGCTMLSTLTSVNVVLDHWFPLRHVVREVSLCTVLLPTDSEFSDANPELHTNRFSSPRSTDLDSIFKSPTLLYLQPQHRIMPSRVTGNPSPLQTSRVHNHSPVISGNSSTRCQSLGLPSVNHS
jgi:hypothetical protein